MTEAVERSPVKGWLEGSRTWGLNGWGRGRSVGLLLSHWNTWLGVEGEK